MERVVSFTSADLDARSSGGPMHDLSGLLFAVTVAGVGAIALAVAAGSGIFLAFAPSGLRRSARVQLGAAAAALLVASATFALSELTQGRGALLDRLAFPWCWGVGILWVGAVWRFAGWRAAMPLGLLFLALGCIVWLENT